MFKLVVILIISAFADYAFADKMATLEQCKAFAKFQVAKNYLNMGKGSSERENKMIEFQYNFFIGLGNTVVSKASKLDGYNADKFDSSSNILLNIIIDDLSNYSVLSTKVILLSHNGFSFSKDQINKKN